MHLLHVLVGQGRFIWDVDSPEHFLPLWGRPGHAGQGLVNYPTDATRDVLPIACHSHNDYWRRVPLFDAIHHGCTSVEADVWLFDEDLYIGHSMGALARNRTLQNLYLNPLAELLDQMNAKTEFTNATGRGIFDQDPNQSLVLLIDFKTNGQKTTVYGSIPCPEPTTFHHEVNHTIPLHSWRERLALVTPSEEPLTPYIYRAILVLFVFPAVLFTALQYASAVVWMTIMSNVLSRVFPAPPYNFTPEQVGFMSVGPFIGNLLGAFYGGILGDWSILYFARKNRGYYEPEMRLRTKMEIIKWRKSLTERWRTGKGKQGGVSVHHDTFLETENRVHVPHRR